MEEHFSGDRRDDRQHHHRENDAGGHHRSAARRCRRPKEWQEGRVVLEPRIERIGENRCQHRNAPDAVDDAGNRSEQVDEVAERFRESPWRVMGDVQRDGDGDRRGEQQADRRCVGRPEHEWADVSEERAVELALVRGERRQAFGDQEDRDRGERHQNQGGRAEGQTAEHPISETADRLGERGIGFGSLQGWVLGGRHVVRTPAERWRNERPVTAPTPVAPQPAAVPTGVGSVHIGRMSQPATLI